MIKARNGFDVADDVARGGATPPAINAYRREQAHTASLQSGVQLASLDVITSDALTPEEEALLAMQSPSDEPIRAGVTAMDRNGLDVASDSYVARIGNTLTRMTKSGATPRPRFDSAETNRLQDNEDKLLAKFWAGDVRLPYGQYPDDTRLPIIYAEKMSQQLGKKISPSDAEVLSLIDEIGQRIRTLDRQLSNQGSSKDAAANILQQNSLRRAVSDIRSGLIDAGNRLGTEIAIGELAGMLAQVAGNGVSGVGVAGAITSRKLGQFEIVGPYSSVSAKPEIAGPYSPIYRGETSRLGMVSKTGKKLADVGRFFPHEIFDLIFAFFGVLRAFWACFRVDFPAAFGHLANCRRSYPVAPGKNAFRTIHKFDKAKSVCNC